MKFCRHLQAKHLYVHGESFSATGEAASAFTGPDPSPRKDPLSRDLRILAQRITFISPFFRRFYRAFELFIYAS